MNWSQIFTGILPLLGVAVGGFATYLTQKLTLDKQLKIEREREREERNIERLKVYSEILKLEGENEMQGFDTHAGYEVFYKKIYREKFRPVFFSKFYLIDLDIVESVRRIDNIFGVEQYIVQLDREHEEQLINLFNKIISNIEKQLKDYKKSD
ncbi:hypothetical protein [Viridibacillus arvi]|uniref:hypothetical protein n=1 Tax=Viridibacillus arvi TaxID=263475 RepID=UPI003D03F0F9